MGNHIYVLIIKKSVKKDINTTKPDCHQYGPIKSDQTRQDMIESHFSQAAIWIANKFANGYKKNPTDCHRRITINFRHVTDDNSVKCQFSRNLNDVKHVIDNL